MTTARDQLSKADTITITAIEVGVPALIQARNLIDRFRTMIRRKAKTELDSWIADARDSLFAPFANGMLNDVAAVSAAIIERWSNSEIEGLINKLKLVKKANLLACLADSSGSCYIRAIHTVCVFTNENSSDQWLENANYLWSLVIMLSCKSFEV